MTSDARLDDNPQFDVFISYSRQDGGDHANRLEQTLRETGFSVWRDVRDIAPDKDFTAEIEKGIEAADHVVICVTPDTKRDNSFVRREIQYAMILDKPVIPLRFADMPPHISIVNFEWVDFFREWEIGWDRLLHILRTPEEIADYRAYSSLEDPFRPYLESTYQQMVALLDQAVIKLIDLTSEPTPDQVQTPIEVLPESAPRSASTRNMMDQLFLGQGIAVEAAETVETAQEAEKTQAFHTFAEAFECYAGRVLLLGEPGAGKTITLTAFARDAIARRLDNPAAPLPLFGIITTWDSREQPALGEWLTDGYNDLPLDATKQAIEDGRTLLLLDGLDELGSQREDEIEFPDPENPGKAKNEPRLYDPRLRFLNVIPADNSVAVSCRVADYAEVAAKQKIALNGAITLQPLNETQMREYLADLPDLLAAIERDDALRDMLSTPLLMSFFAFAYRDLSAEDAAQLRDLADSPGDLRDAILRRYVEERYEWEDRKHGPLAFTLGEIYQVLGAIAAGNIRDTSYNRKEENVLRLYAFQRIMGKQEKRYDFIQLVIGLNLLAVNRYSTYRFIHLRIRDYFAFSFTVPQLHDADEITRTDASKLLGKIGNRRAINPLIESLVNDTAIVRNAAADALVELCDGQVIESLIETLDHAKVEVRRVIVAALGKSYNRCAIELLMEILKTDRDPHICRETARILGETGDERAIEILIEELETNAYYDIRETTANALGKFGSERAIEALIKALETDEHQRVRAKAAKILGKIGDERTVEPLIEVLKNEKNYSVLDSAIEALGKIGDERAVEPLIDRMKEDSGQWLKLELNALREIGASGRAAVIAYERAQYRRKRVRDREEFIYELLSYILRFVFCGLMLLIMGLIILGIILVILMIV